MSASAKPVLRQSIVAVAGTLSTGQVISQEIAIPHEPGASDPTLINNALQLIRTVGGLMFDGESGSVNFYPLLMFTGGINFAVKRITLALSSTATH